MFNGLFFIADFNKDFQGWTLVLPDKAERKLGYIGRAIQPSKRGLEKLSRFEDAEFEKFFTVYTDDPVVARYILSISLMNR